MPMRIRYASSKRKHIKCLQAKISWISRVKRIRIQNIWILTCLQSPLKSIKMRNQDKIVPEARSERHQGMRRSKSWTICSHWAHCHRRRMPSLISCSGRRRILNRNRIIKWRLSWRKGYIQSTINKKACGISSLRSCLRSLTSALLMMFLLLHFMTQTSPYNGAIVKMC